MAAQETKNDETKVYDPKNVFAAILAGKLPCHKVYEDERTLAFMDIMPRADGHVLVIPKAPSRNVLDISADDIAACARTMRLMALAAKQAMGADGITLLQANEKASGQEVYHTHFHILPRWDGVALRQPASIMAKPEILAEHAEKIRAALNAI